MNVPWLYVRPARFTTTHVPPFAGEMLSHTAPLLASWRVFLTQPYRRFAFVKYDGSCNAVASLQAAMAAGALVVTFFCVRAVVHHRPPPKSLLHERAYVVSKLRCAMVLYAVSPVSS